MCWPVLVWGGVEVGIYMCWSVLVWGGVEVGICVLACTGVGWSGGGYLYMCWSVLVWGGQRWVSTHVLACTGVGWGGGGYLCVGLYWCGVGWR